MARVGSKKNVILQSCSQDPEVRLVPVIEMMPTRYAVADRPMPPDYSPEEYFRYWKACLADSGIEGLEPIRFCYVPTEQLTSTHTLAIVIHAHCFNDDSENSEDALIVFSDPDEYLSAFSGGYTLCVDDSVMVTPRCCGDLADIKDWQTAADYRSNEWSMVWIGHPWINVHFDGTHLVFTEQEEENGQPEWTGQLMIAPEALHEAIDQAKQGLYEFYRRLLPVVESMVPPSQAVKITEILTACKQI